MRTTADSRTFLRSATPYRARGAWTAAVARICRSRAVIIGYHGVGNCRRKDDPFMLQLPPEKFRVQVELLLAGGFRFVTVAELTRRAAGRPPPPGLAAVTFDDGMQNVLTNALPILEEHQIPATVYVPTSWIGAHSPWIGAGADGAILTESELQQLAAAGWELGSHTLSHADLSKLDYEACREEIDRSCQVLEQVTGSPASTMAYPFGRYNDAAIAAARDAGLHAAVATNSGSWRPYELKRAMIGSADPFPAVLLKLVDRCDSLLRSRALRAVRQASDQVRGL